jgi:hypothetical protein
MKSKNHVEPRKTNPLSGRPGDEQKNAQQDIEHRRNRLPSWVACVITAIYAVFAALQWNTMRGQLHLSQVAERAYIQFDEPTFDIATGGIIVPIDNVGRTPSGTGISTIYASLVRPPVGNILSDNGPRKFAAGEIRPLEYVDVERLRSASGSISPNRPDVTRAYLRFMKWSTQDADKLKNKTEMVAVAGTMLYDDNFGQSQSWFCYVGHHYDESTKQVVWVGCPSIMTLQSFERAWSIQPHPERHQ